MNAVFVPKKRPVFFPESLALGFHSNLGSWVQGLWFCMSYLKMLRLEWEKTQEWKIYWNWHVAFLVMSIEVFGERLCSKLRTALLFLGVRWNLIFCFGSLPQPLHDMSVCWLKLAARPVLQRPKWITWQGSKRATILEHQKDRSLDSFGKTMRLQRPLFVSGNACGSLQHARFVDVCGAGMGESWGGVFCFFVLVSWIGQIMTVNLIVSLLWVVVVLLLVVV